jgi:proline iminopeptidase
MKRAYVFALALLLACCANDSKGEIELWPEIEPHQTGHLEVSGIHSIYYEVSGNPRGKTVFVLHGGPGGSSSPYYRRFFNPETFRIVLHDQRGCGKSTPYADIRENTTEHLVADIERLRTHLDAGTILLFGGSWGATLALAYAEAHPENVSGIVLRGVFTATSDEIDHFYHGGTAKFFPETYERFSSSLPDPQQRPIPPRLLALIEKGSDAEKLKYSRLWAAYEIKISGLDVPDDTVEDILRNSNPVALGLLENHYMAHGCFLEEGQLLADADRISHIRTIIVNGRYDMICPPISAYRLHRKLPNSKLVIAEKAGHWMGEPPIQRALLEAMREFE